MKKFFLLPISLLFISCSQEINKNDVDMIVGTYTDSGSYGLYSYKFNEDSADFELLDSCNIINPSYLTFSENNQYIYSVSELHDNGASVVSLKFSPSDGSFEILNQQPTNGFDPCYIATNGKIVTTANYGGSMSVFPIEADGKIAPMSQFFEGSVGGPDSIRQNTPHIHCTEFSVDKQHLFISDFSADRLLVYKLEDNGSKVVPLITDSLHQMAIELEPDYGPRHVVFDKTGKYAYVIGEISGKITVLETDGENIMPKQVIEADSEKARGSADIHISPDGKFLYASNRLKNDGITIFKINQETGELSQIGYQLTGIHPRNFAITPNGKYLLCACRDTNEIQIFEINNSTGLLTEVNKKINLKKPVCIKFAYREDKI